MRGARIEPATRRWAILAAVAVTMALGVIASLSLYRQAPDTHLPFARGRASGVVEGASTATDEEEASKQEAPSKVVQGASTATEGEEASKQEAPFTADEHEQWARGFVTVTDFEQQAREATWAPKMEHALREWLDAVLVRFPGSAVPNIECRTNACRVKLTLTADLKARLRREDPKRFGFLVERLAQTAGGPAPYVFPLWANDWKSSWLSAIEQLGAQGTARAFGVVPWSEMLQEECVLAFSSAMHAPDYYRSKAEVIRKFFRELDLRVGDPGESEKPEQ